MRKQSKLALHDNQQVLGHVVHLKHHIVFIELPELEDPEEIIPLLLCDLLKPDLLG
jgi:hypothetical protein